MIDVSYEICGNCPVFVNYMRIACLAISMSEKACVHVYCTLIVSLLADKIRSRRARERTFHL